MDAKGLYVIKVVISMAYCLIIGWVISRMGLRLNDGVLIGALITLGLGIAGINSPGPSIPVIVSNNQSNTMDSSNLRNTVNMNAGINQAEKDLPNGNMFNALNNTKGTSMEPVVLAKELIYRRSGGQQIIAALVMAAIAFIPYLKFF